MHRFVALILLFIVPLQFAWSAVASVHGHGGGEDRPVLGLHAHERGHAHQAGAHEDHAPALADHDVDDGPGDAGPQASHSHPVFSVILRATGLAVGISARSGVVPHAPSAYISRIPPLLDRPPPSHA